MDCFWNYDKPKRDYGLGGYHNTLMNRNSNNTPRIIYECDTVEYIDFDFESWGGWRAWRQQRFFDEEMNNDYYSQ